MTTPTASPPRRALPEWLNPACLPEGFVDQIDAARFSLLSSILPIQQEVLNARAALESIRHMVEVTGIEGDAIYDAVGFDDLYMLLLQLRDFVDPDDTRPEVLESSHEDLKVELAKVAEVQS